MALSVESLMLEVGKAFAPLAVRLQTGLTVARTRTNGNGFKKRTWVTCKFCKGDRYV